MKQSTRGMLLEALRGAHKTLSSLIGKCQLEDLDYQDSQSESKDLVQLQELADAIEAVEKEPNDVSGL